LAWLGLPLLFHIVHRDVGSRSHVDLKDGHIRHRIHHKNIVGDCSKNYDVKPTLLAFSSTKWPSSSLSDQIVWGQSSGVQSKSDFSSFEARILV